eukprot:SAG22_NODE_13775_length_395_cov_0.925676_1_plen_78_part_01
MFGGRQHEEPATRLPADVAGTVQRRRLAPRYGEQDALAAHVPVRVVPGRQALLQLLQLLLLQLLLLLLLRLRLRLLLR